MNSIVELKDALIANQIFRIQSLTREQLIQELIELHSSQIEALSDTEVLHGYAKGNTN